MAQEAKATIPLQDLTMTPQVQPIIAAEEHQAAAHIAAVPIAMDLLAGLAAEEAGLQVAAEEDNHIFFSKKKQNSN